MATDPFYFLRRSPGSRADAADTADTELFAGSEPVAQSADTVSQTAQPPAPPDVAAVAADMAPSAVTDPDQLSPSQIVGAFAAIHARLLVLEALAKMNGWQTGGR